MRSRFSPLSTLYGTSVLFVIASLVIVPADLFDRVGYLGSLAWWLVPVLVGARWAYAQRHDPRFARTHRAYVLTAAILTATCFLAEWVLAHHLFRFPNHEALLGVALPGLDVYRLRLVAENPFPVEELLFYIVGGLWILTAYVWADHAFFPRSCPPADPEPPTAPARWAHLALTSLAVSLLLLVPGVAIKALIHGPAWPYLPTYLTAQHLLIFAPALVLLRVVGSRVNWRAFGVALVVTVAMSAAYEARIARTHNWWDYRPEGLTGLSIGALQDLPVEAVSFWVGAVCLSLLLLEAVRGGCLPVFATARGPWVRRP